MKHRISVFFLPLSAFLFGVLGISVATAQGLTVERIDTPHGVPVYFTEAQGLPIIDIQVLVQAGSAYDGTRPGLAALTSQLLDQRTTQHTAQEIATQFASLGARYGHSVGRDWATYSLRSLTDQKVQNAALQLFTEVLSHPRFDQKSLARQKANTLVALNLAAQEPQTVAEQSFMQKLYGNHPYAHSVLGNQASVSHVRLPDVENFYRQYYGEENIRIVIVGAINATQAKALGAQIAKAFPHVAKARARAPIPPNAKPAITLHIAFQGTQDNIMIGALGITRHDANYFPLMIGNFILGGDSMASRLFDHVREEKGLAYVVQSYFLPMQQAGPWIIFLQTRNEKSLQAIKTSQDTLNQFLQTGPTPEELNKVKQYLVDSFAVRFASNADKADGVALLAAYDLPMDYFQTYAQKVNAVTREQVHTAFAQLLAQQGLLTVVVGQHAA